MKLLIISVLFSCTCAAQFSITPVDNSVSNANQTSYSATSDLVAGKYYVYIIETGVDAATPNVPSMSATGVTFTQLGTVTCNTTGTPRSRITAFGFLAASSATALSITADFAGQTQNGRLFTLFQVSGGITTGVNGIDAVVQTVTSNADAGANPSITMSALTSSGNGVIAAFTNDVTPFGGTVESGWTLDLNSGHDVNGFFSMYRRSTNDNTPTVTASASDWGGIAIELKSGVNRGLPLYFFN